MMIARKQSTSLYVDRGTGRFVVLDSDGDYWTLPTAQNAWDLREPFSPNDETDLESVPGHYKYMLGIFS